MYFCDNAVLLLKLYLRALLAIMLAFKIFLIPYDTITNIASRLHKDLGSNSLSLLGINSFFFRNLLNYNALNFLGFLNYPKKLLSKSI